MVVPELPEGLLGAGAQFYEELKNLGIRPEGLMWMHKADEDRIVLLLLWSGVDKYGPLEFSKLLFQAYNTSALTKDVDPFLIEIHSPKDILGQMLLKQAPQTFERYRYYRLMEGEHVRFSFRSEWIYHLQRRRRSSVDVSRDWRRFKEQVTALAA